MYLLELSAQNVRNLSPQLRAALRPGYVALQAPQGAPFQLAGLTLALLYPEGRGQDVAYAVPGQKGKAALTLLGNDQGTYRAIRELGGPGALQRLNKASQSFELVTQDSAEMVQFLRGQVGLPSRATFEQLYTFTSGLLPSRRPRKAAAAAPKQPSALSAAPADAPLDPRAAAARLAELQRELVETRDVEELQFKADGLAQQVFAAEQKLQGTEGIRAALAQAQADHEAAPSPEKYGLPPDIAQRAEEYPKLVQRRDDAMAKLEAEHPAGDDVPQAPYVPKVTGDQRFWAAIGGGIAAVALAFYLGGAGRYLALLDIPAFGFAALLGLQYVGELEESERHSRKGGMRAAREKKIHEDFEREAALVKKAMAAAFVSSPAELIEALGRKPLLLQKIDEYRQQLSDYESDPAFRMAADELQTLKAEQDALNQRIAAKGQYVRDPREVERDIAKLKTSMSAPPPSAAPAALAPGEKLEDPCPGLLSQAADLLQIDGASMAAASRDRCAQYVTALTDRRWVGVEFDVQGHATAISGAGGKRVPAGEIGPRDLDLLYLSLRLTLVEKVSAKVKIPFLIEDGLPAEEAKLPLLARMLRHLGTVTQVLHVTSNPAFVQVSEAPVNL